MRSTRWIVFCSMVALVSVLCVKAALLAEPPQGSKKKEVSTEAKAEATKKPDKQKRVSVEVARERAKLTHNIYAATLDVIHHRYFRRDTSAIPARAMEDVFSEIARQENIKARWIAVNTKAMSIDHRPRDNFEKRAAKEIGAGKKDYEQVENGVYRRAAGISLMNRGCLGCHLGFGANAGTKRFAGLVITIPVTKD